ncbi:hypothetical protein FRX31_016847 [Thalictrum thalictroides]|uniref:Uncharacterized protein n=1 Tax=Thalictrum thalictroides TaxID=46969 RepID=A0A7J6W9Q1_THATH|nr:hypothetical protein FRX31_016847 [Thalictrum thalictroides]
MGFTSSFDLALEDFMCIICWLLEFIYTLYRGCIIAYLDKIPHPDKALNELKMKFEFSGIMGFLGRDLLSSAYDLFDGHGMQQDLEEFQLKMIRYRISSRV